jgi:hypothetical protein
MQYCTTPAGSNGTAGGLKMMPARLRNIGGELVMDGATENRATVGVGVNGLPGWKSRTGTVYAVILSFRFLLSGGWKLTDLDAAAERMVPSLIRKN